MKKQPENSRLIHEFEGGPIYLFWQNSLFFGPEYKNDEMRPLILHDCRYHSVFVDFKITPTLDSVVWEKVELAVECEECEECVADTCPKSIEEVGQKGSGMQISETLEGWFIDLGRCTPWDDRNLRPIVKSFAMKMEKQLSSNEDKGGWEGTSAGFLLEEIHGNLRRLREAINSGAPEEVIRRAANVANFAMMLAENEGKLES